MEPIKRKDYLLVFIVLLIGLIFRRTDAFLNPQFYAEDGTIFFQQAENLGLKSLITPYAGYFHTTLRVLALIPSLLKINLQYIPAVYSFFSFMITYFIGVQLLKSAYYLNLKNKVLFATIMLFVPIGAEMFMNITNCIWILSLYLINFLLFAHQHYEKEQNKWLVLSALLIISLTGPYSLLLSPVVVFVIYDERKSLKTKQLLPYLIILFGGSVQLLSILVKGSIKRVVSGTPEKFHILKLIEYNVGDLLFMRNTFLSNIPDTIKTIITIAVFLILLYFIFNAYNKLNNSRKYILILTPFLFLASFIAAFWPMEYVARSFVAPRYYFVPFTCIMWIFLLAFDYLINIKVAAIYLLYFIALRSMRSVLPDKQWKKQIQEYQTGNKDSIEINPKGWSVKLNR